jgi:nucleoside triphosphate pyrophosphatase
MMDHPQLVLASQSPARRAILRAAGLDFHIHAPAVDERRIEAGLARRRASAAEIALTLAQLKARSVAALYPGALVIGADQVLLCEEARLSKVETMADAARRLAFLSGKYHHLVTALALVQDDRVLVDHVDNASLLMRRLASAEIDAILAREGEAVLACVGCYRLEGPSVQLFERIEGDHFAMLGLPLLPLLAGLRQHGVDLYSGAAP